MLKPPNFIDKLESQAKSLLANEQYIYLEILEKFCLDPELREKAIRNGTDTHEAIILQTQIKFINLFIEINRPLTRSKKEILIKFYIKNVQIKLEQKIKKLIPEALYGAVQEANIISKQFQDPDLIIH